MRGFVPGPAPALPGIELGLVYEPAGREVMGGDVRRVDAAGRGGRGARGRRQRQGSGGRRAGARRCGSSSRPGTGLRGSGEGAHRDRGARARPAAACELRVGVHGRDRRGLAVQQRRPRAAAGAAGVDGTTEELVATGLLLGVDAPHPYEQRERAFAAGDVLFAFTDGLRGGPPGGRVLRHGAAAGAARRARAARGPAGPRDACREVQAWTPRLDDDVVILALRRCSS